jgi:hypothetical protein
MRAGRFDIVIVTGSQWSRQVQLYRPDTPIEAQAVVTGSRVFYKRAPALVHSAVTVNAWTTIQFGHGLWTDPFVKVEREALVVPALPDPTLAGAASFTFYPQTVYVDPRSDSVNVGIPVTVNADGSATLAYAADETASFADMVGASSWDMYAQTGRWDWQRILEGTLTIVKGDTR